MSRKRQVAALFNHAAATKMKRESGKGQVVQKVGNNLHICFNVNMDARYLVKTVRKGGCGETSRTLQANNESVPL